MKFSSMHELISGTSPHFDFVNHMLDKSSQTLVNNVYILYQKVLKSVI